MQAWSLISQSSTFDRRQKSVSNGRAPPVDESKLDIALGLASVSDIRVPLRLWSKSNVEDHSVKGRGQFTGHIYR